MLARVSQSWVVRSFEYSHPPDIGEAPKPGAKQNAFAFFKVVFLEELSQAWLLTFLFLRALLSSVPCKPASRHSAVSECQPVGQAAAVVCMCNAHVHVHG